MTDSELEALAAKLTEAQRRRLLESGPDDITGREGLGVEIKGAGYRVARRLEALGLGYHTHGDSYFDMYWNNPDGLALRTHIMKEQNDG